MIKATYSRNILLLLLFLLLFLVLSFLTTSAAYIITGFAYSSILIGLTAFIGKEKRLLFRRLVCFFLLFYSICLTLSHYTFIDNPFQDFYVNIDETNFFSNAVTLSKLSYLQIWQKTFLEFQYSNSPLFFAWVGTLQKIIGLDFFSSLLFQKLNVAFVGSFVPGIVFLLCRRITDDKAAFKAAMVYGLLSFVFIYSLTLMRDIHIALIYGIGLYIITGKEYNLRNYITLLVLGLLAYYIRSENGLFFLAFLGIWLLKSGSDNKMLISLVSIASIGVVILVLGGFDTIYNMAIKTVGRYNQRAIELSDQGSLGLRLRGMPFPLNFVGLAVFGQISPFPFWAVFRDDIYLLKNIFYVPEAISAVFWFSVWSRIISHPRKAFQFYHTYKYVVLTVLLYILIVSWGQAGPRRLMAVYPLIFMAYIFISPRGSIIKEFLINISVYILLIIVYLFLKM